ncbi:hypothetical protein NDU88_002608 [Pleurodeles waltl]|uniref:Uncharacterized protein n=1 Tax=Pleurodeles waltl TaxID=8319 RepID=A0AAV7SE77_PLEWA|nr:hypothetical protein NDU88_002608 [Pleurodeles waltl]
MDWTAREEGEVTREEEKGRESPRGPDNWRRGGPTIYGSVTTHDDTNPNGPARSRGVSVHQHALTVSDHTAGRHSTAT